MIEIHTLSRFLCLLSIEHLIHFCRNFRNNISLESLDQCLFCEIQSNVYLMSTEKQGFILYFLPDKDLQNDYDRKTQSLPFCFTS